MFHKIKKKLQKLSKAYKKLKKSNNTFVLMILLPILHKILVILHGNLMSYQHFGIQFY